MVSLKSWVLSIAAFGALLAGCTDSGKIKKSGGPMPPASSSINKASKDNRPALEGAGLELLSKVAEKYAKAKTFKAISQVKWVFDSNETQAASMDRLMLIESPNRFRVVNISGNLKSTSVSDGHTILEHTNSEASLYHATSSIATATAVMISNANYCGSFLYNLFSRPVTLDEVVSETDRTVQQMAASNGNDQVIEFRARDPYGRVQITVDPKKLEVKSIRADMTPMLEAMQKADRKGSPDSMMMIETFSNIKWNDALPSDAFVTKPPPGLKTNDRRGEFVINGPAPLFALNNLDGKQVALKDLRDRIVILAFFTSLNPDCSSMLAICQDLEQKYSGRGLTVIAISPDTPEVARVYLQEFGLKLNAVFDQDKKVFKQYRVVGKTQTKDGVAEVLEVPNLTIVDRRGRISGVILGAQSSHEVQKALRLAGLEL